MANGDDLGRAVYGAATAAAATVAVVLVADGDATAARDAAAFLDRMSAKWFALADAVERDGGAMPAMPVRWPAGLSPELIADALGCGGSDGAAEPAMVQVVAACLVHYCRAADALAVSWADPDGPAPSLRECARRARLLALAVLASDVAELRSVSARVVVAAAMGC